MPKFLNLISQSGKDEYVDISEFNKNPNAYGKYKIRMVDDATGKNYNIPATMFGQAQKDGLRAWNMEKQTTKQKRVQNPAFQTPMPNGNLHADWGNAEMVNPKGFDSFGTNVPTTKAQQDAKDFIQGFDDAIKGRKTDGTDAWRDTMQRMANMNIQSAQKQFEDQIDYAQATGKPLTDDFLVQNLRNEENGFSMNKFGVAPTVARDKNGKPILDQKGDPVKGWATDDVRASVERQTDIAARQRELELNKKTTEEKLSDLYRQRESLKKKLDTGDKFTSMYQSQYGTHGVNNRETQLQLIEVEKAIQSLEAVRDKDELAWNGFFRGFENTAGNLRSWDFGLSDLALMGKMEEIKGKINKGQQLTADEQELAISKIGADAAAALEDETMGNTYRWAKIGGESLPFMADFMLTGGYRGIAVKFAREASKLATKTLARNVLRNTGTLIGDVVGAYGMALTTQVGKTTADILRRHQGSLTVDENGNFKFEGGESMPSAIAHGLNAAAIENYTEKFGEHLNFAKAFGKYGTEGMTQFFQNLSNKGWAKTMNAVAKRGGINGYIPEVIEEEIGLPLNALITGDNSWSDVLDVKQQADILGGMAISIGAMGALGLGVHLGKKGTARLAARHYESKLNDADFNATMAFDSGKWMDLRDVIDNTENKYMPSVQDHIIKSPTLTPEQKIAVNKYINTLLTYRGFNLGLMANMNNAKQEQQPARTVITPTQIDGKTSYAITYYNENGEGIGTAPQTFNTLENAEMYKQMLDEKRNDAQLQDLYSSIYIKDRDGSMRQSLDQQLQTVGLSLNDISRILNKSPFRRTDKEIQALDIMQNIANGMVYPPNEVHEEKDAQDGADLAEGTPVGDQATIDIVNEREANAISQWNQVADPDLQSSIKDLYEQGKTSNDIFDWLVANEYSEDVIAAFAELCNSGAQKDKFIEVTGQKIEEQVNQKVQQVTFAGTLNGSRNPAVIQVQDQTGIPMYVVSGDISIIPTDAGNVIQSDGLIVLRDENGNFIQRPDTSGLTIVGTQNADEYKNQLLTQTQEAVTAQIQSTEYKAPEYNDSDMESQAPEASQGNGLTAPQPATQPANTNEQQEQEPAIPTDEDGNLLYHKAPIEATINELYDGKLDDEEIRDFVQNRINESSKEHDKINKKKPKIGTDKNAYLQAKTQWQSQVDEAKQQLDYWNSVQNYIQQQTHTTPEEIKAAQDELSGTTARLEYARQAPEGATTPEQIAGEFVKNTKIQPEDFYRETGLTAADARKQYPGILSNNGATIASLAEQLVQYDNDNYGGMFFKGDDIEARNYIIEALKNAPSRKSLGRDMTAEEQEYARVREQQREDFYQEAYGMSYSDYLAFEEQEMPNIWRRISNFAPEQYDQIVAEYYESLPEDYFTPQNEQQNGTEEQQDNGLADSTTVLPQPPTDNEAGSGQRENPAAETGTGSEGDNQNEEVPGGTQGVGLSKIISEEDFDINSIDFENNYVVAHQTLSDNAESIINNGLRTAGGLMGTSTFVSREEIERLLKTMREGHGHRGSDSLVIMQFPKSWFNGKENVKLDDISTELSDRFGFDAFMTVPSDFISNVVNVKVEKSDKGQQEDETAAAIKKDIEDFISKSTHDVQITNYDEEDYEAQISVDGKPSNIVITPPMEYGESMHAEYRPTEGGYQELGDLLDEYNEGLEPKEQGVAGEHLAAIFSSVDAAIDFEKWLNDKNNPNDWENLTEEQKAAAIDADTIADENAKELAKDFLRGDNTSTIAEVFYREIVGRYMDNEEVPKKKEEKPSKPKPSNIPPVGQAAIDSGKLIIGGVPESKPKEDKPKTETPPATGDKSDVGKALDEFKDVMARFRKAGRTDANVSLIGLNARQIEMLGEVFRATAKLGYALIKSGTTTFENWLEAMKTQVSDIIKRNSNWNDQDITELLTETWNNKYLVDGERKPLSQWAAEEALAAEQEQEDQKQEKEKAQPATVPDSSAVGQSQLPFTIQEIEGKTKEDMISLMWDKVYPLICAKHKVPSDILDKNAYWFSPRMTTGYDKDSLIAACMKYMEHLNDEVQPASEKQMNYIMKLAAEDEKKLFKNITLTKTAASRVITLMKREEDMINNNYGKKEDFDEIFNELEKIARLNGANIPEARSRANEIAFVDNVIRALENALETGEKPYSSITTLRKAAREAGMEVSENGETDIKLQELVEDALVRVARKAVHKAHSKKMWKGDKSLFTKDIFETVKLLYNLQPTISMRSSNRVALQQYSTPLPMAFVADMFATNAEPSLYFTAFEPTAGNGMLVFGIRPQQVYVNEIDENRLENLRMQDYALVTSQDATQPFTDDRQYDAIITNPPFGEAEAKDYDGYKISGLAQQIALNALSKMRDFGKAVIIIGGKQEFAPNGAIKNDKPFLTYLYNHYNVKGVIDMEGSLYAKQGTTFPTRMILIDGRRTEEERAKSDVYPPTIKNWLPKADSFDKLYDTVKSLMESNEKTNGTEIVRTKDESLQPDRDVTKPGQSDKRVDSRKPVQDVATTGKGDGTDGSTGKGSKGDSPNSVPDGGVLGGSGKLSDNTEDETDGGSERPAGRDNGPTGEGVDNRRDVDNNVQGVHGNATHGVGLDEGKRSLESDKLSYRPHNGAFSLESVAPAAMVEAMDKTLKRIEEEYGNIDEFVTSELGYDSVDAMHKALAAEQVDSVAMAIYNMKKGEALIIGDQTGVGKGRQMAALIRWARRQGKKPIFMTQKANLFNDIYRDLKDIGSGELKPFIFNQSESNITEITEDENGNEKIKIIYKRATDKELADALKYGKIPDDCDFVLCTYSQVSTGDNVSREYEDELNKQQSDDSKKRSRSRKTKPGAKPRKDTKAVLLRALAKDNYLMLDESHTAAGESNQGFYMQTLVRDSKAVTFASATYAKRPDTMPLYALRTAMSKANIGMRNLIAAIQKGGVTLQEIMSRALSDSGQMVRRERDMTGVVTDWTTIDDPETVKRARENYDKTIQAFNAIIDFQNVYVEAFLNGQRASLAVRAGNAGYVKGTDKMGISNTPFANKTYNYTKQLMLALKVDAIVDEVDRQIKAGRRPVIALDNTMGSMLDDLAIGEEVEETTFAASLIRGLQSIMQYMQDDGMGNKVRIRINPSELGTEGETAYYQLISFIKESTKGVFISPLDEITTKLRAKGYKVGELTGRDKVVTEENGKYYVAKKGKVSKQLIQSRFNSNALDVLILNKTASTGISLHASKTFADQRQRVMILAQPLPDINDYMQMIGRIDRTGQVKRGYYINLGLPVPAEQRFLMMLSTKLKSLNANTTTSQESKDNKVEAPDMLNKYGSQVIVEYFKDHPDVYNKLNDPLNVASTEGGLSEYTPAPDDSAARKLTGYVALLSTDEQQAFYDDVVERYNTLIKYLDDTGTNDLKITSLPLGATTLARAVSSEGNDPTGDNPFAQNAYVEMVEMNVLRKPMKASEINTAINTIAKGKDPKQAVEDIKNQYEDEYNQKLEKQKRRYEAELERNKEALKKFEDKINSNEKMPEEDKKKAIEEKKISLQQDSERKNDNAIGAIEFDHERMVRDLDLFKVGSPYLIPDNLDALAFDLASPGIFLGFKAKENGITPSSTLAVFATLDGRRRVEVKLSERGRLSNINETTNQNYDAAQEVNLSNWDSNIPNITRKTGYIMTGNILQAINDSQDENGNFTGQLISFTDSEDNIRDGILMPDKWEPTMMVNAGKPIASAREDIESGKPVRSMNGEVEIYTDRRYGVTTIMLRVPKSKKLGAKYYENEDLRNAIDKREFYQNSGKFQVAIPNGKLDEVLSVLSSLGVKVPSDVVNQLNDSSQQDNNRLAYSSNTNNVNNSRIVPEDVDKDVSLQIENEFDSAIENLNLTEEEKAELDKHISDYSNKSTIELEDMFYINNSRLGLRNEKKNNLSEMLWRRGNSVSEATSATGINLRDEKSGAESPTTANGEYSAVVSRRDREAEGENTARGNEVQGQHNGPRDIRNSGSDRLLLHEGRRIEEKVLSKNSGTKLSSNQRRLLAAQYAISRELVYRDIRLAALKQSLGLEEGKTTSLDEIADVFEKTNTDKEVKTLFDKILAINKRLGTSVDIQASQEEGASGEAGTRRDVYYYLDGFTRTSAGKINIPVVIAHELLHQGTIGAINLVKKGKAEGVLTKEQIDAVNTIIDIYNKVKTNPERLSESKRGLANPYEFAAQMVDPRQRRALSMSPLQRVIAAANELRAQGNNTLWERVKNALKTLFGMSDLKKMDNAINTLLDTFSETVHDISMNDVDQSGWGYTSTQLFDKYPTWLSGQTTGTGQHTTQITSTVNTYKKIGEWMKSQEMKGASVLDASSGLGKGTEALRDMGFNVEDVEPYPSETRTKPTYLKYEDIKGKYDVVISNAVLNVIPDDWRADVLKNMADKVKPGGKMIINVRDAKEMERQKQKIELDSPSEILVTDKAGNIRAYQKGFTQKELADWIQSELGEGWTIETAKPSNSGISGRAVVVTRNTETPLRYRKITDSMQKPKTSEDEKSRMTNAATSLAESINTPIKVISAEEAPEGAKNSKGYYDTRTGEVTIVLDNNTSPFDVQRTVAHEVIGHKGLSGLLGKQNYYKIMNAVYDNLPQDEKDKINEAARRNGWQMYTAIDEYLADQAENMVWDAKSASLWQNVKHYLAEALRTLGFIIKPNLKDARYWLWLSKNQLKRGDVMSNIKRNALLAKLDKLGNPKLDELFKDNNDDTLSPQYLFRTLTDYDIEHKPIQESFQDYAISLKDFLKKIAIDLGRKILDNENAYLGENQMGSIAKGLTEEFINKKIKTLRNTIKGMSDVFGDNNLISKTLDYFFPQSLINRCEYYLYAKHGLERNRVLYVRDLNKKIRRIALATQVLKNADIDDIIDKFNNDFQAEKDWLSSELKIGNISYMQYLHGLDDFVKNYVFEHQNTNPQPFEIKAVAHINTWYKKNISDKYDPNKIDYSGLSAFEEYKENGQFKEDLAIDRVMAIENSLGSFRVEKLWEAVQDVTQHAIDVEYKSGMISKATYDRCKTMFEWYIPLRGVSVDTMEDLYAYLGGKNDNGSAVETAKGRKTVANTPLATAYNMALRAINEGVRNQNNQRMYRAVNNWLRENPGKPAPATVVECWYELNNNGVFEMKTPDIVDGMTPEEITQKTREFIEDMKTKQRQGLAATKNIRPDYVKPFSNRSHANDHIVYVKINGVRKMIIFNGDPRPARVLRGEMNPGNTVVSNAIRKLSVLNTAWNPTFTLKNLWRDSQEASDNVLINEGRKYYKQFKKNQLRLMGDAFWVVGDIFRKNKSSYLAAFYKWRNGEEPTSYIEKMYFDFMKNGGATGFMEYNKLQDLQNKLYNDKSVASILKNPFATFGNLIAVMNELTENLNRFATYMTSIEMGRSVMTSVNNAKEITLNFNRRGAAEKTAKYGNTKKEAVFGWWSWWYKNTTMFFNPAVQSLYRNLSNMTRHPFKWAIFSAARFIGLSMCIPAINELLISMAGGDDDDKYSDLAPWVRRNNICIYNPFKKNWITLPISPNIAPLYGLGDIAYGYLFDSSLKTGYGLGSEIASQVAALLPFDYLGNSGSLKSPDEAVVETLAGDFAGPIVNIALNKNWLGNQIYKDTPFNKDDPEWQRCYSNTNKLFVWLSKSINSVDNDYEYIKGPLDNKFINPAIMQHLWESYSGGFGKEMTNGISFAKDGDLNKLPVFRGFVRTPDNTNRYQRTRLKYNMYRDEADKLDGILKKLQRHGDLGDPLARAKYIGSEEKPNAEFVRMMKFKQKEEIVKAISKRLKVETDETVKEAMELEINRIKKNLVDELDQIED